MVLTRFQPPPRRVLEEQIGERLRRTQQACSKAHQSLILNRTTDKQEVDVSIYKQRFPDTCTQDLMTLARVKLIKPWQFVTSKEGDPQTEFGVREVLVYAVAEAVYHPDNKTTDQLAHCLTRHGWFQKPNVLIERDDLQNIIKSSVKGWTNQYYIPWDNGRSAQAVIDQFDGQYKGLVLAESALGGESWYSGHTLSVFNLQEFLEIDWDTLANSNRAGVLTKEYGGYIHYVKAQEEKQRKLKAEVAEYTASGKTNLQYI